MKSQVARVIEPNGTERIERPVNGKKFTLEELQGFVGGLIEHVDLPRGNGHSTAWINEEGLLIGMAINKKACEIYRRGVIVGPMVIVSTEVSG